MRALVVEDDEIIAGQIVAALSQQGAVSDLAADGEAGVERGLIGNYSLIILDIMLPKLDGLSACKQLREAGIKTPVLILTARDEVEDRVKGLDSGADDYLAKPFDVRELLARVRALARRDKVHRTGIIKIADLSIDVVNKLVSRAGKEIHLTPREFSLLIALAENEGRTLTREVILESVWGNEESLENTVNFHVASLRKKIDGSSPQKLIQTVHGFGYRLKAPEDSEG